MPAIEPVWKALDKFWKDINALCPVIDEDTTCKLQRKILEFQPKIRRANRNRPLALVKLLEGWGGGASPDRKCWTAKNAQLAKELTNDFVTQIAGPFLRTWREYVYRLSITLLVEGRDYAAGQRRNAAVLNFSDLLLLASRLVRENPNMRESLQRKYRRIFVDEFQDTDPLQTELVFLLAAEPGEPTDWTQVRLRPGALFLVGDPKQSIYRFRRADIEIYQEAKRRIEQTGGEIVELTSCFRSSPEICDWANKTFGRLFPANATATQSGFQRLDAGTNSSKTTTPLRRLVIPADTEQGDVRAADAEAIAAYIRSQVDAKAHRWGDFLIVTRKKSGRLSTYAAALERAKIPYEVSGAGGLTESPFVATLLQLMYALSHPDDAVALVGVLRGPVFGVSDVELYAFRRAGGAILLSARLPESSTGRVPAAIRTLQSFQKFVRQLPPGAALNEILERTGLLAKAAASSPGGGEAGKLLFALDRLRAATEAGAPLGDAVADLENVDIDDESDAPVLEPGQHDVVRLMNLHKVKGLEADVVFLADPLGGVKPRADIRIIRSGRGAYGYFAVTKARGDYAVDVIAHPHGWDQLAQEELEFVKAEELRLLYVASTRARDQVIVSQWPGAAKGAVQRPWQALELDLQAMPAVPVQSLQPIPDAILPDVSVAAREAAHRIRDARAKAVSSASYLTRVVSDEIHTHSRTYPALETEGARGRDWGSLIHSLLEHAASSVDVSPADLENAARWHAAGDPSLTPLIPEAVQVVSAVVDSPFWQRVKQAEVRLTETPVMIRDADKNSCAIITSGIIDLLIKTNDGWEVIDYKTDLARVEDLASTYGSQVRSYASLWKKITGEHVSFAGVYSVRENRLTDNLLADALGTGGRKGDANG
jgi:ATP-dependent helicase/nuclease subunit A